MTQNCFEIGKQYLEDRNFESSITYFNYAINKNEKNQLAYFLRAKSYFALEKYKKAISDLECSIIINENHLESYKLLIECYKKEKFLIEALEMCKLSLEKYPKDENLLNEKKEIEPKVKTTKTMSKTKKQFEEVFEKEPKLDPRYNQTIQFLKIIFKKLGKYLNSFYKDEYKEWLKKETKEKREIYIIEMWKFIKSNQKLNVNKEIFNFHDEVKKVFKEMIVNEETLLKKQDFFKFLDGIGYIRLLCEENYNLKQILFNPFHFLLESGMNSEHNNFLKTFLEYKNQKLNGIKGNSMLKNEPIYFQQLIFLITYFTNHTYSKFLNTININDFEKKKEKGIFKVLKKKKKKGKLFKYCCKVGIRNESCQNLHCNLITKGETKDVLAQKYIGKKNRIKIIINSNERILVLKELEKLTETEIGLKILIQHNLFEKLNTFLEEEYYFEPIILRTTFKIISNIFAHLSLFNINSKFMKINFLDRQNQLVKFIINTYKEYEKKNQKIILLNEPNFYSAISNAVLFQEPLSKEYSFLLIDIYESLKNGLNSKINGKLLEQKIRLIAVFSAMKTCTKTIIKHGFYSILLNLKKSNNENVLNYIKSTFHWIKRNIDDKKKRRKMEEIPQLKIKRKNNNNNSNNYFLTVNDKNFFSSLSSNVIMSRIKYNGYFNLYFIKEIEGKKFLLELRISMFLQRIISNKKYEIKDEKDIENFFLENDAIVKKREEYKYKKFVIVPKEFVFKIINNCESDEKEIEILNTFKNFVKVEEEEKEDKEEEKKKITLLDIFKTEIMKLKEQKKTIETKEPKKPAKRIEFAEYRNILSTPNFKSWHFVIGDLRKIGYPLPEPTFNFITEFQKIPNVIGGNLPIEVQDFIFEYSTIISSFPNIIKILKNLLAFQVVFLNFDNLKILADDIFETLDDIENKKNFIDIPFINAFIERSIYFSTPHINENYLYSNVYKKKGLFSSLKYIFEKSDLGISVHQTLPSEKIIDEFIQTLQILLLEFKKKVPNLKDLNLSKNLKLSIKSVIKDFFNDDPKLLIIMIFFGWKLFLNFFKRIWEEIKEEEEKNEKEEGGGEKDEERRKKIKIIIEKVYEKKTVSCNLCKKPALKKCSRCKKQYYCSANCQRKDWKNHRLECGGSKQKKKTKKKRNKFNL